jgi:hypothetical protein
LASTPILTAVKEEPLNAEFTAPGEDIVDDITGHSNTTAKTSYRGDGCTCAVALSADGIVFTSASHGTRHA